MKKLLAPALIIAALASCGKQGPMGPPGVSNVKITQVPVVVPSPYPYPTPSPAPSVTPVQLCPSSFVPTYPTTFPEYALCINGSLYGVYSANGGFLTELPPGQYNSDGVNASCTFTIEPNCVVTQ